MNLVFFSISFLMAVVSAISTEITDPRLTPAERAEVLAGEEIFQQIGFPFNDPRRMAQSLEMIRIAETLVEWSRLEEKERTARIL